MIALAIYSVISAVIGIGFTVFMNKQYPMSWMLAVPMAVTLTLAWPLILYIMYRAGLFEAASKSKVGEQSVTRSPKR